MKEPSPQDLTEKEVYKSALENFTKTFNSQVKAGKEKYGTTLKVINGRNPYQDFLQESVDGLQYATQIYLQLQHMIAYVRATDWDDLDLLNSEEFLNFISNVVDNTRILSDEEYNKIKESFIGTTVDEYSC